MPDLEARRKKLTKQEVSARQARLEEVIARLLEASVTGRNPRHFDITFDQLDDGVDHLCRCEHEVVANPYHEGSDGPEVTWRTRLTW